MEQATRRRPGRPRKFEAFDPSQPGDVTLPATGDIPEDEGIIERVSDMATVDDKTKVLAFMEEPVEVMIDEDPTGVEPAVFCAVNGEGALLVKGANGRGSYRTPWLPRGRSLVIRRKFVERLARARKIRIRTDEVRDAHGDRTTAIRRSSSLPYTFHVIHDPNPEGIAWLRRVMAEA